MIILRLLSFIFFLAGLAVVVAGAWILMGGEIEIPKNDAFGEMPAQVTRMVEGEPVVEAQAAPGPVDVRRRRSTSNELDSGAKSDGGETAKSAPTSRGFGDLGDVGELGDGLFQGQMSRSFEAATEAPSLLDQMREVPIAYAAPEKAQFARPFEVTVAIDATGDVTAIDALPSNSTVRSDEDATVMVTDKVKAQISGSAFEIEALSPGEQMLSPVTENVWRWRVEAQEGGPQELTLEIFGFDGEDAIPVRAYRDQISVEVTRIGQAVAFAEDANPLAMLLGGIGSALAGFFGFVRFFRKGS